MDEQPSGAFRIGLIGPLPPPSGGMANQTKQLYELLEREGIVVSCVRTNGPYVPAWTQHVRVIRALFRLLPYVRALWRAAGTVDLFHILANSGKSWYLSAVPAIWIARLHGVPVIVNYRGGLADEFLRRSAPFVYPTLRTVNTIVVPSRFLERVFQAHGFRPVTIPNIIDVIRFAERSSPEGAGRGCRILLARNLEKIYGVDVALRAFQIVREQWPDATMTIAGTGPEYEDLLHLAQQLGISDAVTFAGQVNNERMPDLYGGATVSVNASRVDNMPISILESLAGRVPVVSTDAGGIPYLVTDRESALLVAVDDHRAIASAIIEVHRDESLRSSLVDNGYRIADKCSWQHVRHSWLAIYQELVERRVQGPTARHR